MDVCSSLMGMKRHAKKLNHRELYILYNSLKRLLVTVCQYLSEKEKDYSSRSVHTKSCYLKKKLQITILDRIQPNLSHQNEIITGCDYNDRNCNHSITTLFAAVVLCLQPKFITKKF